MMRDAERSRSGARAGFGMLEALVGLIVFVVLVFVGTKAFRYVVDNHSEAKRLKGMNDALTTTAEWLSTKGRDSLVSSYANWSSPQPLGDGKYSFRYRIVPAPTVGGKARDSLVGLQMETGKVSGGTFSASASYTTVFQPASGGALGQTSTLAERTAERAWYATHTTNTDGVINGARTSDPYYLDSWHCYDPGECCGAMGKYYRQVLGLTGGTPLDTNDGLESKCYYRCALNPDFDPTNWKNLCGLDICGMASAAGSNLPWKNQAVCCDSMAAGKCPAGSLCYSLCRYCFSADSADCAANNDTSGICQNASWTNNINCATNTFCDGSALPDSVVSWWRSGSSHEYHINLLDYCKSPVCGSSMCDSAISIMDCCTNYWKRAVNNDFGNMDQHLKLYCSMHTTQSQCCDLNYTSFSGTQGDYCGTDGRVISSTGAGWDNKHLYDNVWYCGDPTDNSCSMTRGCATTYKPPLAPTAGSCQTRPSTMPAGYPVDPPAGTTGSGSGSGTGTGTGTGSGSGGVILPGGSRGGSSHGGGSGNNGGGNEG